MVPQILIASTTWWATPARMALAFIQSGASVSGVFPRGNPLAKVRSLKTKTHYGAARPLRALRKAIATAKFDLIVPCDDRVVQHLHRLHAESSTGPKHNEDLCKLIERSLGSPGHYSATLNRSQTLWMAKQNGIQIPKTAAIHGLDELRNWEQQNGFPAVLKVDGTWGGSGVRVVHTWAEAATAYEDLTKPLSLNSAIAHASFHNFYPLFSRENKKSEVTVQTYIEGSLANSMFACWKGEVLGALHVEVLFSHEKLGSSTIVRTFYKEEMEHAGRVLAKVLSLSGFFGLDFILESKTGTPYLIELNPRATQLGHLEPSGYQSLVTTLSDRLTDGPSPEQQQVKGQTIAFFPQSLRCDSENPLLAGPDIHHDVPWHEPALVEELKRRPWNDRHLSALPYRFRGHLSNKSGQGPSRRAMKRFELKPHQPDE